MKLNIEGNRIAIRELGIGDAVSGSMVTLNSRGVHRHITAKMAGNACLSRSCQECGSEGFVKRTYAPSATKSEKRCLWKSRVGF